MLKLRAIPSIEAQISAWRWFLAGLSIEMAGNPSMAFDELRTGLISEL
jgi:hypothetical protein